MRKQHYIYIIPQVKRRSWFEKKSMINGNFDRRLTTRSLHLWREQLFPKKSNSMIAVNSVCETK